MRSSGFFHNGNLSSVGIQCALCHSTVDDSFAPGIGRRLDGWANRVRHLPRAPHFHGARLEHAQAGGDRHRSVPGEPLAG
jgi:hypothetical protein